MASHIRFCLLQLVLYISYHRCKTSSCIYVYSNNVKINLLKLRVNSLLVVEYVYFNNPIQDMIDNPRTLYLFLSPPSLETLKMD